MLRFSPIVMASLVSLLLAGTARAACTSDAHDFNDGTMQGWTSYGSYSAGTSGGEVRVSGDSNGCTLHGIQKDFSGGDSLSISYDYSASSTHSSTTNQAFVVFDASTGTNLFGEYAYSGGGSVSGSYSNTLTSEIAGVSTVRIVLGLYDCWSANWSQTNTLDNITVEVCTEDEDGWIVDYDCDDTDPQSFPGNGVFDANCDALDSGEAGGSKGCATSGGQPMIGWLLAGLLLARHRSG